MKLFDTLKPISAFLGALILSFALGAGQAVAQDDVTVSIESQEAQSGEAVDVPVNVTNFDDVGSISLTINYDPDVLSFPSDAETSDLISGAPRDGFTANVAEPGELRISWFDGTGENPINLGDGSLLTLNFSDFSGGTSTVTFGSGSEITNIQAETIGATYQGGVVADQLSTLSAGTTEEAGLNQTVSVPLSGEGLSDVGSVSLQVKYDQAVAQFEGLANDNSGLDLQADTSDGVISIGGFNADGTALESNFVELEFTFLGGATDLSFTSSSEVTSTSNDPLPVGFELGQLSGDAPTVSFSDRAITSGGTVTVPVRTSELQEVGSASIDVTYNPATLTFDGSENPLSGFDVQVNSPEAGVVRIAGFNADGVNPSDNNSRFVDLQFTVASGLSSGSETTVGFDDAVSEVTSPSNDTYNTTFEGGVLTVDPEPTEFQVATSRDFGDVSDPTNYELVALPGQVDVDVSQTLSGSQGTGWRVFREQGDAGDSGDANLQEYDGSNAFNFRPGRAFWVISQNEWSFEGTVAAVQEADGTPSIALSGGWNAISNPLQAALEWSALQAANGLDQPLWRWNGGWEQADSLGSATEGEAYYIFNGADLDSLDLSSTAAAQTVASNTAAASDAPKTVELSASTDASETPSRVTIGLDPNAEDASTYRAPPTRFEATSLRVVGDDATYMRMVTPTEDESEEFDLQLEGQPGAEVTLDTESLPDNMSSEFGVTLVDSERSTTHDLRTGPVTITIPENGEDEGVVQLSAVVGTQKNVAQTTPDQTQLNSNYPNPFTEQTTIEYTLSDQTDVTVKVYNVLGQQVATLAQESKRAGTHRIEWDGQGLSSGTYFVRLKANGTTDTRQITVVR